MPIPRRHDHNTSLPSGTVGQAYSGQLAASGGTPGYTFSITAVRLCREILVERHWSNTGTPQNSGTSSTTFRVQDSTVPNQQSTTKPLTITNNAAPPILTITTTSPLPPGKVGDRLWHRHPRQRRHYNRIRWDTALYMVDNRKPTLTGGLSIDARVRSTGHQQLMKLI